MVTTSMDSASVLHTLHQILRGARRSTLQKATQLLQQQNKTWMEHYSLLEQEEVRFFIACDSEVHARAVLGEIKGSDGGHGEVCYRDC